MQKVLFLTILAACLGYSLLAQNITIQPYLQDATPHSISILWETDSGEEGIVEWGLTDTLGQIKQGISYPSEGGSVIHEVALEGLERFTKYFYKIQTGTSISVVHDFKTPPFASDNETFRMVAMSDMQKDNSHPDKFREIVEEGVIEYLEGQFGESIAENLALVLIPGDLVVNGNDFNSWRTSFFNPGEKLFSKVPVYPVLGNHEYNTTYYFSYFKMPENGTKGFEEHWWYKDYGNVRIIGLDSNSPFDGPEQLNWLDNLLTNTCAADSIDFVFAQLHHPFKSELWTPGESDFTGEVINRLEQFSTGCGKPSIHFFGHTHGYSRGQSRDHKHLWINVATAGGAIDNWGEFPNFDYDEFSVSQDDYGFVVVEITDDPDPSVTVKRISRGDQDMIIDNQLTDSLTFRLYPSPITKPTGISPAGVAIVPECITLQASEFSSLNPQASHGQTHWQITTVEDNFTSTVYESWKNFENWYYEIDTQQGDDLTDEDIPVLPENSNYWWRVKYRDKEMNWSDWSDPVSFSTGASIALPNLLLNPGAENDLEHWTITEGVVEALSSGVCDGVAPNSGEKYFIVGGLCEHSDVARATQNIDVSTYADSIDTGIFPVHFGGYLSNWGGSDLPEMKLVFLDENFNIIGISNTISTLNNSWTLLEASTMLPIQTRIIQVELKGTRNSGTDNDSYFDDLFVKVGTNEMDCNNITSNRGPFPLNLTPLEVHPNPMQQFAHIRLPKGFTENIAVNMMDSVGNKVVPSFQINNGTLKIERGDLPPGTYFIWLRSKNGNTRTAKVVVSGQ